MKRERRGKTERLRILGSGGKRGREREKKKRRVQYGASGESNIGGSYTRRAKG